MAPARGRRRDGARLTGRRSATGLAGTALLVLGLAAGEPMPDLGRLPTVLEVLTGIGGPVAGVTSGNPSPPTEASPAASPDGPARPRPTRAPSGGSGGRCTHFLAPDGDDAAGGSIDAPRRTLLAGSALLGPGDVLCLRGGRYTEPGGVNWAASGRADAPITVRPYPGESAVLDGRRLVEQGLVVRGHSHLVFEDLTFTRFRPRENGVILVVEGARDVVLRNIRSVGHDTAGRTDHHVYVSGAWDVRIEGCVLDAIAGVGINIFGGGGSHRVEVRGCTIDGPWTGVLVGSGSTDALVTGNDIVAAGYGLTFPSHGATGQVTANRIDAPRGIWIESLDASPIAEDHNELISGDPFVVGWPGTSWTLGQWQATGRGEGTMVAAP